MSTMPQLDGEVILGVDTHEREHVAALIDPVGRLIGTRALLGRGDTASCAARASRVRAASAPA